MVEIEREDDGTNGRFILTEDGQFAGEINYLWDGQTKIILDHTGVEEAFSGKGYAKQLVLKSVEFAREQGIKIEPLCPYARSVFDRDESLSDVRF